MAGPDLTPELLAQLGKDAAWFSPDEGPYRLGIKGERTIDGEEEDADEMTIYGAMDDGASYEVATFHVDDMAPHAVRIFAALPALVAAAKERDQLRTSLADKEEEIRQLSEMLGASQIDRADLGDQVDQLRAEVAPDLSALREAVDLVIERCECGDNGCPFKTTGGMRTNGGCRMAHDRVRGHQLAALGALFKAARALLGDAPPAEATTADVWRTEAERLRGLLGQMIGEAMARPGPHVEWAKHMESEMEKSP